MDAIKFKANRLFYLDQTRLPAREVWRECKGLTPGIEAIKNLEVRGAPLIGVFAAYCLYIWARGFPLAKPEFLRRLKLAANKLTNARPTAVNLSWAVARVVAVANNNRDQSLARIRQAILNEARAIHWEDIMLCGCLGDFGVKLINQGDRILTHCNAGSLATAGEGTALAVVYKAQELGKKIKVYVDETRPLLQGARLTAWELSKRRIDTTLICDNMAAWLMAGGQIDKVFVGADRIAANGDTANKIGTYSLAINARYHKIPLYVVAPFSSFDLSLKSGKDIPIEERRPQEVQRVLGKLTVAPRGVKVRNPAFDVTPFRLITAIVSDRGIIYPPLKKNIKKV